jgi:flagellar hook-basal body complex protein FliE
VELAQVGEQKGNFEPRLAGALDVLQKCQAKSKTERAKATQDHAEYLRSVCDHAGKQNPHNLGMV